MNKKIYVAFVSFLSGGVRMRSNLYAFSSKRKLQSFLKFKRQRAFEQGDSDSYYSYDELDLSTFDYSELL